MIERIRVLIVDDEHLARVRIRDLLKSRTEIDIVGECDNSFDAIEAVRRYAPDLVFLDVQMPEKDGFFVIEKIGVEQMPAIIFITAYDQYALRAFQVHALDYLLKPFDNARFEQVLQRAVSHVRNEGTRRVYEQVLGMLEKWKSRPNFLERIIIKSGGRMFFLKMAEIDWIKADGNYVRLYAGTSSYLMRDTLRNLEVQIDPGQFLRIHRSTIVNIESVRELHQLFHGDYRVILKDGTQLMLSRKYRENLPRFALKSS
jgi:two-component system LytT family response regulator